MRLSALALLLLLSIPTAAKADPPAKPTKPPSPSAAKIGTLLSATTYKVEQADPNLWTIPFEGKTGSFQIFVTTQDDLAVIAVILLKKATFAGAPPEIYKTLLHCNHDFDKVKVGVDDDGDLFLRVDSSIRLLDGQELSADIEQVAACAENVYKIMKPYVK